MKSLVYFSRSEFLRQPFTHAFVAAVFRKALAQGYTVELRAYDDPLMIQAEFAQRYFSVKDAAGIRSASAKEGISGLEPGTTVLCSGSLDLLYLVLTNMSAFVRMRRWFWYQGLESDESFMKHRSWIRRVLLMISESLAIAFSHTTIVPSNAMVRVIRRRYPFLAASKFVVLPNLTTGPSWGDPWSYKLWGFDEEPVLALGYLGGISVWQCFEETCGIVEQIERDVPGSWFLVLTPDRQEAEMQIRYFNIPRWKVLSTSSESVGPYVDAFHAGFLLRKQNPVNTVSCPIKWLEYWRCGVPVVTTGAVEILAGTGENEAVCLIDPADREGASAAVQQISRVDPCTRSQRRQALKRAVAGRWTWDSWGKNFDALFTGQCVSNTRE